MNIKPEISVIMSVYNGEKYLAEAIDSIIGQTFKSWELIIVNDCSLDSTGEILERYALQDERIRVLSNEVNLKLPTSLNKAIENSRGRYIARMDADDISLPERLEKQYSFMENNKDVDLSSCRFMNLKGEAYYSGGCGGRCDSDALNALLLVTNPILHPGVIAKAEVMKELNYDTSLTCSEDLELWTRMVSKGKKIQILPRCLLLYRLHDKQITQTTLERQHSEVLKIQNKLYRALLDDMSEEMQSFYITGVYFKENADVNKFIHYAKWLKSVNRKKKFFKRDAIDYALFEMLAEYKRCGVSKTDVLRAMSLFAPTFLVKEIVRRKKTAKRDIAICMEVADKLSLIQTSGTKNFPVFSKGTGRS